MAKKSLEFDMVAGSQLRDTQSEMLSVEGADISELEAGRGRANDNHGKGAFNCIGRITSAKKIFSSDDCSDPRHTYYWNQIRAPFIYAKGYLFDDEDHPNARAAAAILRNIYKTDSPLKLKASVEGGVIARGIKDPSLLARTKIHSVALTFTPANNATLVEPLNLDKSASNWEADLTLIKSVMHLAETNVPSFRHIARDASATKVQNNLSKLVDLMKELGIEGNISIPSKQKILEKALEQKITDNLEKINQEVKLLSKTTDTKTLKIQPGDESHQPKTLMSDKPERVTQPKQIKNKKGVTQKVTPGGMSTQGDAVRLSAPHPADAAYMQDRSPEKRASYLKRIKDNKLRAKDEVSLRGFQERKIKPNLIKTDESEKHIKDCSCGTKLTTKNAEYKGIQKLPKDLGYNLHLYNCPKCHTTVSIKKPHSDLEKGIKDSLAAAGMSAAMAIAPSQSVGKELTPKQVPQQVAPTHKISAEDIVTNTTKQYPLLGAIACKESSCGKNLNHKMMTYGPHKGHTAGGPFGMMPNSGAFTIQKDSELAKKYPKLLEAAKNVKTRHKEFTDAFNNNPQLAADFAISLFNRTKKKTRNDHQLVYGWLNGTKGSWNKYREGGQAALEGHPYVKDVMKEYDRLKPKKNKQNKPLMKALMAGYGGAGTPTSAVGGSVVQTESLDQGRPSFKYVTCDNCGDEQVYAKHQIKCRECGQNMSLEKLYNIMVKK